MPVVAGWKSSRRSEAVATAVTDAVRRQASAINSAPDLRSVQVVVKFKNGSGAVRAVLVMLEAEHVEQDVPSP